jgi:hypothetical protein
MPIPFTTFRSSILSCYCRTLMVISLSLAIQLQTAARSLCSAGLVHRIYLASDPSIIGCPDWFCLAQILSMRSNSPKFAPPYCKLQLESMVAQNGSIIPLSRCLCMSPSRWSRGRNRNLRGPRLSRNKIGGICLCRKNGQISEIFKRGLVVDGRLRMHNRTTLKTFQARQHDQVRILPTDV